MTFADGRRGIRGVIIDISERIKAEDSIRASDDKLKTMFNTMSEFAGVAAGGALAFDAAAAAVTESIGDRDGIRCRNIRCR